MNERPLVGPLVSDCRKTDYYQIRTDKHIANTAENIFRTDKALIIS